MMNIFFIRIYHILISLIIINNINKIDTYFIIKPFILYIGYRIISFNKAGLYYANTLFSMIIKLPKHLQDIHKRPNNGYSLGIINEKKEGIYRTLNALEIAVIYLFSYTSRLIPFFNKNTKFYLLYIILISFFIFNNYGESLYKNGFPIDKQYKIHSETY